MKSATVANIRKELKHKSNEELAELCLRLSRFKKENKELLTYLLFEADYEAGYIETIKTEIDEQFDQINTSSFFYIKKSVRKILRNTKKYTRYSLNKETEVELLLYFCQKLKAMTPSISRNTTLTNLYDRNIIAIKKKVKNLHEDLQYDYKLKLEDLE
jgi:predicted nucleotide-binding protein (sugar kinase/HSP70/actin superfamily)